MKILQFGRKEAIFTLLSILSTIIIFSYLFQTVSPSEVLQVIRDVDRRYLIAFVILSLLGSLLRSLRFRVTLIPSGASPSIRTLFFITLVRNLSADLLPARIGTLIYIYLANERLKLPLAKASSSFALAFLFDIIAIAPLLGLIYLFEHSLLTYNWNIYLIMAGTLFAISSALLLFLPLIIRASESVFAFVLPRQQSLHTFLHETANEIRKAKNSKIFSLLFFLSVLIKVCKYGSLYIFLVGILIPIGYKMTEVPILTSTLGILSAEVAASLPISGIAGFGAYEGAWAAAFSLIGFPGDLAKLTGISHHLFTQVYGYLLGAGALLVLLLPMKKESSLRTNSPFIFTILAGGLSLFGLLTAWTVITMAEAPVPKKIPLEESKTEHTSEQQALPFPVVFDSNRSGTFGIYIVNSDGVRTIIDNPRWHEIYPDPSPDGDWIVYARARTLSRNIPSEIWLIRSDGSEKTKIIENGNFPTFSADGKTIYYEYNRSKVHAYSLSTKTSREIFPLKRKRFKGVQVVKPRVSPDGRSVAFTSNTPQSWHAWQAPLESGKPQSIALGCEPAWFPDGDLAWIKKEGLKAGSGIMKYNRTQSASTLLKDDGAPYGHEYFPSITPDGRYLLYSATTPDRHSHLDGGYQVHLYDLKKGTTRLLTSDNATNRWPKMMPSRHLLPGKMHQNR